MLHVLLFLHEECSFGVIYFSLCQVAALQLGSKRTEGCLQYGEQHCTIYAQ